MAGSSSNNDTESPTSKTAMVKNLSNSPRAREQHQAMQTTKDLQNHIGELADLSSQITHRLQETIDSAETTISEAQSQSQTAAKHQHQLQKNALTLQKRQNDALKKQQSQIQQLMTHENRQQRRVPWLILGGAIAGALTASLVTFAGIWLMM
ncbi:hypothetical protein [Halospina sp. K52047b]|uniref:hypothetical protein n=1 Tax=Halospina sp. K52047b TaxID=2614160 RepID=UPI001CE3E6A1|nr:hypothetical protein [Halospina sp. K52047b]